MNARSHEAANRPPHPCAARCASPSANPARHQIDYEAFEIHARAEPVEPVEDGASRYTYAAYVCHPGADVALPGHTVPFHSSGDESFGSEADAIDEALHVGRSIIDGTHPDLSVLSLVTHGY